MNVVVLDSTRSLRNLYFVRTVFQVIWAATVIGLARTQPQLIAILFVFYPLWDVACTVYDLRTSSQSGDTRMSQRINALLGVAAAIGIGSTVFQQPTYAVAVFGAWALGAGALQLIAGLIRRKQALGGQWAMILRVHNRRLQASPTLWAAYSISAISRMWQGTRSSVRFTSLSAQSCLHASPRSQWKLSKQLLSSRGGAAVIPKYTTLDIQVVGMFT
jgi:hypothetical protein